MCVLYNSKAVKSKNFTGDFRRGVGFMAKNLQVAVLLDYYGDLLTEKQRDFISLYYEEDLSLSEIAENEGITRQGVRDAIKRAEALLFEMEEKLGFAKRFENLDEGLAKISAYASEISRINMETSLSREISDLTVKIRTTVNELS